MGSQLGAGCRVSRAGMPGVREERSGCWVGGGGVEVAALVGLQRGVGPWLGLRWLSVVNKQRQVPESLDGADLGSGAPGMWYLTQSRPSLSLTPDSSQGSSAPPAPRPPPPLCLKLFLFNVKSVQGRGRRRRGGVWEVRNEGCLYLSIHTVFCAFTQKLTPVWKNV